MNPALTPFLKVVWCGRAVDFHTRVGCTVSEPGGGPSLLGSASSLHQRAAPPAEWGSRPSVHPKWCLAPSGGQSALVSKPWSPR